MVEHQNSAVQSRNEQLQAELKRMQLLLDLKFSATTPPAEPTSEARPDVANSKVVTLEAQLEQLTQVCAGVIKCTYAPS